MRQSVPEAPGLLEQQRLAARLADVLAVPSVDLVVLDRAPLERRARVIRDGRVLRSLDEVRRVRFDVDSHVDDLRVQQALGPGLTDLDDFARSIAGLVTGPDDSAGS